MVEQRQAIVKGSGQRPMLTDIRWDSRADNLPVVIFVHGFKGFKDWGPFPMVCDRIANFGFVVVSFNFSHNGTTPDAPLDFADLEAFGQNNYSKELYDLGCIIDWVMGDDFPVLTANRSGFFLIGHSRGGGDVVLKASEDKRIKALATWAAVDAFGQWFDEEEIKQWEKEGVLYTYNGRTGQYMPMYFQMREDFLAHQEHLDIPKAAGGLSIPWLIVHGDADPTVPVSAAMHLLDLQPKAQLLLVPEGDHTFGGKHPWTPGELPRDLKHIADATAAFFLDSNLKS